MMQRKQKADGISLRFKSRREQENETKTHYCGDHPVYIVGDNLLIVVGNQSFCHICVHPIDNISTVVLCRLTSYK